MRKIIFLLLAVLCVDVFAITDSHKTIFVDKNTSSFIITLPSNPTTGFIWLLESYDRDVLRIVKHDYLKPDDAQKMGAPGVEKWVFKLNSKIVAPQITKVTLLHARPWELANTSAAETKTFTIVLE